MNKLILLLGLVLTIQTVVSAQSSLLDRRVTLQTGPIGLEDALFLLSDRSGVSFSFSSELLPEKVISLDFRDESLRNILPVILEGTDLACREVGGQLVFYFEPSPVRNFTISGFLEDADSGERLLGASIFDRVTGKGAVTNEYGFFSITLPPGQSELSFSYIGYETKVLPVLLDKNTRLNVALKTALVLAEVIVVADDENAALERTGIAGDFISPAQIRQLPSLGGESDLIRTTHLLPGVQTGADGIGGIHIRGGNAGHNLILIDGVPVYNVLHAAGVLSVFNTNAIRSAKLIKGGFPARYGGRLSSVLDIRTKEGNMKETKGSVDLGLLSARFSLEGPIVTDKSSFFVSGRWSFLDQYIRPFTRNLKADRNEDGAISYQFYDLNAKINHTFSDRNKVYLSYYRGSDAFFNDGESTDSLFVRVPDTGELTPFRYDRSYREGSDWGNTVAALRWNHLLNDKLFINTTLTFSKLAVAVNYQTTDSLVLASVDSTLARALNFGGYRSSIRDVGGRIDVDYIPNNDHYLRFGVGIAHHRFNPGAIILDGSDLSPDLGLYWEELLSGDPITATAFNAFLEDDWQLSERFSLNAGVHLAAWQVGKKTYTSAQPRLSAYWKAGRDLGLRASFGTMTQFLHLLSSSGYGLPTDLWVPSTATVRPQSATHWEAGVDYNFGGRFDLSVDGYYKKMNDLLTYSEGANFLNDWENNVTSGQGTSRGIEFSLRKSKGKTTGWVAYTLSRTDRQYAKVNFGRTYPYSFDRRHDLKVVLVHQFRPWLKMTANWIYGTGVAFSLPLEEYTFTLPGEDGPSVPVLDFGDKNSLRIPPYHRLDISLNLNYVTGQVKHNVQVGVYNLYDRKNPLYYNLRRRFENTDGELKQVNEFVQVRVLPFLPSLNYSLKF